MAFWDRWRRRRADGPTLGAVHEVAVQVQGDVRRVGAALVRAETQLRGLAERLNSLGAETAAGMERLRREQAAAAAAAGRVAEERGRVLLPFLDLADSFGRALRAVAADGGAPGGEGAGAVDALRRLAEHLERILRDAGLEALAAPGVPFDPRVHRAVGAVPRPAEWRGRVVLVDRQGYLLDGALLRPAEVWVAVAEAAPEAVAAAEEGPPQEPPANGEAGDGAGSGIWDPGPG